MKRNLKKLVLCLTLTVVTAVTTLTAYAGHGGGGGGGGGSHSHASASSNRGSMPSNNGSGQVRSQVVSSSNSNAVSSNHSTSPTTLNHVNPSQFNIGQVSHTTQSHHNDSNPQHTVKKLDSNSALHSLINSSNHQHHNLPPFNKTHYCGNNPYWRFPIIWWLPNANYCNSLTSVYYTPIYPANAVMVIEPVTVVTPGIDLMLQTVGAVDAGNPAAGLGPSYRVTIRNNSNTPVGAFNVMLLAGLDQTPKQDSPATVAKIEGLSAGQTMTFDVRLPVTSLTMGQDAAGQPVPFSTLFVAVDSNEQVPDVNRANNGAILARNDIPAVLP